MKKVGFLITGNEVVSGKIKDTNSVFMSEHLRRRGVHVRRIVMCGDDRSELLASLDFLSKECEFIVMTGGLGPTTDDLTAEVVAEFIGKPCIFVQEAWDNCVDAFVQMGRTNIPESNRKQAYLPEGCRLIINTMGTAAGFVSSGICHGHDVNIYALPGVPSEMKPMFETYILPEFAQSAQLPFLKCWQVFALGESTVQQEITKAEEDLKQACPEVHISYQAHMGYVTFTLIYQPQDSARLLQVQEYIQHVFAPCFEQIFYSHILYEGEKGVGDWVVKHLYEKNLTLAYVESSTAGGFAQELGVIAGEKESEVIRGGFHLPSWSIPGHPTASGGRNRQQLLSLTQWCQATTGADIILCECGVPDEKAQYKKDELQLAHSLVALWIAPHLYQKLSPAAIESLLARLQALGWQQEASCETGLALWASKQWSTRHNRENQQKRTVIFTLGSLVLFLRGLEG